MRPTRPVIERFWEKVLKTEACWLWTAGCRDTDGGHGQFRPGGTANHVRAHRMSWIIHNGEIPPGLYVLHHCDVPRCVRPDHLFLGTQTDNMADKVAKGRHKWGEDHRSSKLNNKSVRAIRRALADGQMPKVLAEKYGVDRKTIYSIGRRRLWAHLD